MAAELEILVKMKDEATKQMNTLGASIKQHQKAIGIGMAAVGASILAVGGMTIKTASNIEEMTAKFDVVFGETADSVKEWAKITAEAMGRSRFAMMEMASSVQDTFVPMGFARDKAAEMSKTLTALAIDVGSFNNKLDTDVMRDFQAAIVGQTETVRKYGIIITAAGVEQEILNQGWVENKRDITEAMKIQARMNMILAGTTDAQGDAIRTSDSFANQMKRLKARTEEVSAVIGTALLPIVTALVDTMGKTVSKVAAWTTENPKLTKVIVLGTIAFGALLTVFGSLLLILPSLSAGILILKNAHIAATISTKAVTAAQWLWNAALTANPIGLVIIAIAALIAGGIALYKNWDSITSMFLSDAEKSQREIAKLADEMTETVRKQLEEARSLKLKAIDDERTAAQKGHDEQIDAIRETYGILEREDEKYQDNKLGNARRATDEAIALIDKELVSRLRLLDDETAATIAGYQDQIDALDDQTEKEDRIAREANRVQREAELEAAVQSAQTQEARNRALDDLDDFRAQLIRERALEARQEERDNLRDSIDDARKAAAEKRIDLKKDAEDEKTLLNTALAEQLIRIDNERIAEETAATAILANKMEKLAETEAATVAHYKKQLTETELHIAAINAATAELKNRTVFIDVVYRGGSGSVTPEVPIGGNIPGYATGGVAMRPTLAMVAERGPEAMIPLSKLGAIGGVTITGNTFNVRSEADIDKIGRKLVDLIRVKTGARI